MINFLAMSMMCLFDYLQSIRMESQQHEEPFEMSIDNMIQVIETFNWDDIENTAEASIPDNPFYITEPPLQYRKYYQYFRALLNKEEASQRSYALTTLILRLKSTNYYALMLRRTYFFSKQNDFTALQQEIYFTNCLLNINGKEYQLWTYKKQLFKEYVNIVKSNLMLYHTETQFLDYLLDEDSKNYHVWDYKLWLTQFFGQEQQQIQFTASVLFRDSSAFQQLKQQLEGMEVREDLDWRNCYSLWSYRYNLREAVKRGKAGSDLEQFEANEVDLMRKWVGKEANWTNECGWNYLIGLILQAQTTSSQLLREFLLIAQNIFSKSKNRFAGNAIIQLCDEMQAKYGEKIGGKRETIVELIACDKVRKLYYQYLLEN